MRNLLLQSESKGDIKMLAELAKKIGLSAHYISNQDMQDIGLAEAMKKGRTGEYINTNTYLKKLRSK